MSTWDRIRALLGRERRDLDDVVQEFKERANDALDRREHEMNATPEERLAIEQERTAEIDADLEAIRRRIERDSAN